MKKGLAILLLFSYMLCACGISFSFHHCAGAFKYLTLNDEGHEKKCCKGKKEMSDDCCKSNKVTFSKTDDKAQSFLVFVKKVAEPYAAIRHIHILTQSVLLSSYSSERVIVFKPPPDRTSSTPLFILHSVFLV